MCEDSTHKALTKAWTLEGVSLMVPIAVTTIRYQTPPSFMFHSLNFSMSLCKCYLLSGAFPELPIWTATPFTTHTDTHTRSAPLPCLTSSLGHHCVTCSIIYFSLCVLSLSSCGKVSPKRAGDLSQLCSSLQLQHLEQAQHLGSPQQIFVKWLTMPALECYCKHGIRSST